MSIADAEQRDMDEAERESEDEMHYEIMVHFYEYTKADFDRFLLGGCDLPALATQVRSS